MVRIATVLFPSLPAAKSHFTQVYVGTAGVNGTEKKTSDVDEDYDYRAQRHQAFITRRVWQHGNPRWEFDQSTDIYKAMYLNGSETSYYHAARFPEDTPNGMLLIEEGVRILAFRTLESNFFESQLYFVPGNGNGNGDGAEGRDGIEPNRGLNKTVNLLRNPGNIVDTSGRLRRIITTGAVTYFKTKVRAVINFEDVVLSIPNWYAKKYPIIAEGENAMTGFISRSPTRDKHVRPFYDLDDRHPELQHFVVWVQIESAGFWF